MRKLNHALLASALALACASCTAEKEANYQVIPLPQEVSLTQGNPFKLNENVLIAYPENNALLQRNAEFLSEYIQQATNYAPKTKAIAAGEQVKNAIVLGLDPGIANKEGYVLTTTPRRNQHQRTNRKRSVLWHPDFTQIHSRRSQRSNRPDTGR